MRNIPKETQEMFGYTDEQIEGLRENQIEYIKKMPELAKYNLIAEVVESRNCVWGAKVGDKIVLWAGGIINTRECTNKDQLCLWAIAPLQSFSHAFQERVILGVDPIKSIFKRVCCLDVGAEHCGWGQIVMEIRVEPIQQ